MKSFSRFAQVPYQSWRVSKIPTSRHPHSGHFFHLRGNTRQALLGNTLLANTGKLFDRETNGSFQKRYGSTVLDATKQPGPSVIHASTQTSAMMNIEHKPGALENLLRTFWKYDVNLTRIESRPCVFDHSRTQIFVDFESGQHESQVFERLIADLKGMCNEVVITDPKSVPWFPRQISDLDSFSQKTLDAGEELESDHPGFYDKEYRARREAIVKNASVYRFGEEIPRVEYSDSEIKTWAAVYSKLKSFFPKYACKEYLHSIELMEKNCGYCEENIPQLEDISSFLQKQTGFRLRPVSGLLSARDFLNALAFRTFFSTQYIRHHTKPFYTPEPDICHEAIGHAPLLCDPVFAELSQQYGLASLGASDRDIERLATCYWFSIEFGIYRDKDELKAYGAGLLSSFGELEWACAPLKPERKAPKYSTWDPSVAAETQYPITTFQPEYFVADSLRDACEKLKQFSEDHIVRPFHVTYLPYSESIHCDRNVKLHKYSD